MINFKFLSTTDNKDVSNPEAHHLKLHYMIEFSEMYHFGKSRIRAASELKCWKFDPRNTENVEFWNFSPEGHQSRRRWRRVLRTTYLTPLVSRNDVPNTRDLRNETLKDLSRTPPKTPFSWTFDACSHPLLQSLLDKSCMRRNFIIW